MPNKLTDTEVKKALECCTTKGASCKDCPAYVKVDRSNCKQALKGALDLINRQDFKIHQLEKQVSEIQNANLIDFKGTIGNYKAENESLKEKNSNLTSDLTSLQNDLTSAKAEVERLKSCVKTEGEVKEIAKRAMEPLVIEITKEQIDIAVKLAKAEAYKECIEKIEQRDVSESDFYVMVKKTEFDNLLNELVGDA